MKKFIILGISLFVSAAVQAQDVIIMRSGEQVESKVEEVGDKQIRYRKYANPDGPVYSVSSSEVFVIRFENGTREVITPETPVADAVTEEDAKYSHVKQAVAQAKAPIRDKHMLWGVRASYGYGYISTSASDGPSGGAWGVGVVLDYFPSLQSSSGFGGGISMSGFKLTDGISDNELTRNDLNIDLGWTVRTKRFGVRLGPRFAIPVSSKFDDVDAMEINKFTVGIMGEITWSPKHFDLGLGYAYSFTNAFDLGGDVFSRLCEIHLIFGYRF